MSAARSPGVAVAGSSRGCSHRWRPCIRRTARDRRAAGSAFAATRWHGADPSQERAGQQVQNPDRPPPPYPGIARKLLINQGNTVWRPVLPDGLGADAENRPARGQNGKTSTDPRSGGGGELAMPNCCRGPLIAAVRAVEISANAHLAATPGRWEVTVTVTSSAVKPARGSVAWHCCVTAIVMPSPATCWCAPG